MGNDATIAAFLHGRYGPDARLLAATQREGGEQGYSGAVIRYYDVTFALAGEERQATLVIKDAPLVERRAHSWLSERGLPVPKVVGTDLTAEMSAPLCMEYAGDPAPDTGRAEAVARALAAIHTAALGRHDELPWLPPANTAYFANRLLDSCWRGPWRRLATGAGYTNWSGDWQPPTEADPTFEAAFGAVYPQLEATAERFLRAMTALWEEGTSLTLLHSDFHGGNVRWQGGKPRLIDWEQARYGPLYVDLPNFFTRDEALLYRDALADLGHTIPRDRFLAGYDAARPYVGFKYFGIGLWNWRHGDAARRHEAVQYWVDLALGTGKHGTGK